MARKLSKRKKASEPKRPRGPRKGLVYSGIDDIPEGFVEGPLTEGCLVLEGGAFRGLYTGGVIDALMQAGVNLQATVGVSAGALYGFCYTMGQLGSAKINLRYRHDQRYVGARALMRNQGIIGWDFLFGRVELTTYEERQHFFDDRRRFAVGVTNMDTGRDEYLEKGDAEHAPCSDIVAATCASASMPYVSKPVFVGANRYLDGGCACKIPYQWALDKGYKKVIVVRTREKAFRKDEGRKTEMMAKAAYGKEYPAFAKALGDSDRFYNQQCEELERLEEQGRLMVIYPSEPVTVGRLEGDMEKLGALYHLGYDDTQAMLPQIREYLGV